MRAEAALARQLRGVPPDDEVLSFEIALAVLVRTRADADVAGVVEIRSCLASAAHFLGPVEKRDQRIEVAAELLQ